MGNKISILNFTNLFVTFFIIVGWSFIPLPRILFQEYSGVNQIYINIYNVFSILVFLGLISVLLPLVGNKKWMKILTLIFSSIVLLTNFIYLIITFFENKIFINFSQKVWMITMLIITFILGISLSKLAVKWLKETE